MEKKSGENTVTVEQHTGASSDINDNLTDTDRVWVAIQSKARTEADAKRREDDDAAVKKIMLKLKRGRGNRRSGSTTTSARPKRLPASKEPGNAGVYDDDVKPKDSQ
ncbi:hypothetical protein J8273_3056 [Carpediemonas membranifera]|uniref:Uncharacterized protein n=1 Tax=Carpediemonas membranifera TaxID=201153 RepID=A0A8J6AYE9_9EUKA|nr:hypothetical protein J8273_3056 [Carpediemonas membranifera]|eukprot:KAG9395480.1 hypothetical protein J8273_3056 [Carpediemonas membranifera]